MRAEREKLEEKLNIVLEEIYRDKNIITKVTDELLSKGIFSVKKILDKRVPLKVLDEKLLGLLTLEIYKHTQKELIKPSLFFTETEIKESSVYELKSNNKSSNGYPIVLKNVNKLYDDHYTTTLTIKELVELYRNTMIIYNYETQRNTRIKSNGMEEINVNPISVEEIKNAILTGKFISNTVTLNLFQDGEDVFEYSDETNKIKIIAGELNIVDGFHRSLGMIAAYRENPNLDFITEIRFTNFNIDKARRLIVQEDKQNKIDKKYIKSLNTENLENIVVKRINESDESELQGKITTNAKLITLNKALVLQDIMSNAIKYNFEFKAKRDVDVVSKYLIEFFNELIGIYHKEFVDELESYKKISVINNPNIFAGYIALAKKIQNNKNWKEELETTMKKIDFSVHNQEWNTTGIFNKKLNKGNINTISEYFTRKL